MKWMIRHNCTIRENAGYLYATVRASGAWNRMIRLKSNNSIEISLTHYRKSEAGNTTWLVGRISWISCQPALEPATKLETKNMICLWRLRAVCPPVSEFG